jgi:hypothetical protein
MGPEETQKPTEGRMKMALMMAFGLALATANAQAAPSHAKWMGEASCAAWPLQQSYDDFDKALLLNWVLGWLSRSGKDGADLLSKVDQPTVSRWVDRYCTDHPTDTLISAAAMLETQLADRARYSRL